MRRCLQMHLPNLNLSSHTLTEAFRQDDIVVLHRWFAEHQLNLGTAAVFDIHCAHVQGLLPGHQLDQSYREATKIPDWTLHE
jgi:hypothetical protein